MTNYKAIRKTAFMLYKKCPKRFQYFYNDEEAYNGYKGFGESPALIRGTAFHDGCEHFFDNVIVGDLKDLPEEKIEKIFIEYLPNTNDDIVNNWFKYFAKAEASRFELLRVEGNLKWYMPLAKELQVKMPDVIDRSGHIDRIDQISDTEACIVEYKTGAWYNMEQPNKVTDMNAEIGFYVTILNSIKVLRDLKITKWRVINPTLQKVWENTISKISLTTVNKNYTDLVERIINKGEFEKVIDDHCLNCPYVGPCVLSDPKEGLGIL